MQLLTSKKLLTLKKSLCKTKFFSFYAVPQYSLLQDAAAMVVPLPQVVLHRHKTALTETKSYLATPVVVIQRVQSTREAGAVNKEYAKRSQQIHHQYP